MIPLIKGLKVLETAVGAIFAPTRFSLVRISVRDLVEDGKSLLRNSGVGGGGENLILILVQPGPARSFRLACLRGGSACLAIDSKIVTDHK